VTGLTNHEERWAERDVAVAERSFSLCAKASLFRLRGSGFGLGSEHEQLHESYGEFFLSGRGCSLSPSVCDCAP
jgi:hypothetical protein